MTDWSEDIAFANEMIGEFGSTMILRQAGVSSGPTWDRATAPTSHEIVAVRDETKHRDRDGTTVLRSAETLYVRVQEGVVPRVGDWVLVDGEASAARAVLEVRPIAPGGVTCLFEMDVAR